MRSHPYLRAYMAGITVPTLFLLVVLTILVAIRRLGGELPASIERFAVFPMAVVPNAWGAWNVLRLASATARRIPMGGYGACLALLLPFCGIAVARAVGFEPPVPSGGAVVVAWLAVIAVYFLVWRVVVSFLNELLGVAE